MNDNQDIRDFRRFERYTPVWWGFIDWWNYERPRLRIETTPNMEMVQVNGKPQPRKRGTKYTVRLWRGNPDRTPPEPHPEARFITAWHFTWNYRRP